MTPAVFQALRKFKAASAADRQGFGDACLKLARIALWLRIFGFKRTLTRVERHQSGRAAQVNSSDLERARQYARWIAGAARYLPPGLRCLHQSLGLHGWLRQDGLPSTLRIGVRKDGDALKAHAWVELGGEVVNDVPGAVRAFTQLRSPWHELGQQLSDDRAYPMSPLVTEPGLRQ